MADIKPVVLVADPDKKTIAQFQKIFGDEYDVVSAKDGSKALELSILKQPQLILFYRKCPLIGAAHFIKILRANPRTEGIPLIVVSDEPVVGASSLGFMQGVMVKPFNPYEVKTQVKSVLQKAATAKRVGEDRKTIKGSLEQMSMVDLLQVFAMNRRTGCLEIRRDDGSSAQVYLAEGRVADATSGHAHGHKALYRILSFEQGEFAFAAEKRSAAHTIDAPIDGLLMEGMRQADEVKRLGNDIPKPDALLERAASPNDIPEGMHPVTREIFDLSGQYPGFGDLLDRSRATDLDVLMAVRSLIENGLLRISATHASPQQGLMTKTEIYELRHRLQQAGLNPTFLRRPKIAVLVDDPAVATEVSTVLTGIPGFVAENTRVDAPVRGLGSITLDYDFKLELLTLPRDERMLPLSIAMSAGTIGVLVVGTTIKPKDDDVLSMLVDRRYAVCIHMRRKGDPRLGSKQKSVVIDVDDMSTGSVRQSLQRVLKLVPRGDFRGVGL